MSLRVALFFCLSGFLVYAPWAAGRPPRSAASRAARILPLYYLTLVVALVVLAGTDHGRFVDGWRLLGFVVFAQNYVPDLAGHLNPPTWTLAIEVTFYALVPLIGLAARRPPLACSTAHAPRLLSARPLAYLGTLSYGIYLWHYVILLGLQAHGLLPVKDFAATVALVGGLSIAAAALTWHGIEQPVLALVRGGNDLPRRTCGRVRGGSLAHAASQAGAR